MAKANVTEEALRQRVQQVLLDTPSIGYRSAHALLCAEVAFVGLGLKRVQNMVKELRDRKPASAVIPNFDSGNTAVNDSSTCFNRRGLLKLHQTVYCLFDLHISKLSFGDPGQVRRWPLEELPGYVEVEILGGVIVHALREHLSLEPPSSLRQLFPKGSLVHYTKHDRDTSFGEQGVVIGWSSTASDRGQNPEIENMTMLRVAFGRQEWTVPAGRVSLWQPPPAVAAGFLVGQSVFMVSQDDKHDFGERGTVCAHSFTPSHVVVQWDSGGALDCHTCEISSAAPDAMHIRDSVKSSLNCFKISLINALASEKDSTRMIYEAWDRLQSKIRGTWSLVFLDRLRACPDNAEVIRRLGALSDAGFDVIQELVIELKEYSHVGGAIQTSVNTTARCDLTTPSSDDVGDAFDFDENDDLIDASAALTAVIHFHSCSTLGEYLMFQALLEGVAVLCRRAQWQAAAHGLESSRDFLLGTAFDAARSIAESVGDLEACIEVCRALARLVDGMDALSGDRAGRALKTDDGGNVGRRFVKKTLTLMSERARSLRALGAKTHPVQKLALRAVELVAWAKYDFLSGDVGAALEKARKAVRGSTVACKWVEPLKAGDDARCPWFSDWVFNVRNLAVTVRSESGNCLCDVVSKHISEVFRRQTWEDASDDEVVEAVDCLKLAYAERISNGQMMAALTREHAWLSVNISQRLATSAYEQDAQGARSALRSLEAASLQTSIGSKKWICDHRQWLRGAGQVDDMQLKYATERYDALNKTFECLRCSYCQATESHRGLFKKCAGCGEATYCSADHQKKHWTIHKQVCSSRR